MSTQDTAGNDIRVVIDGKAVTCHAGEYIVDVAKRANIRIPTLCGKNDELTGNRGRCRVCIVEVTENGRTKVVTACNYPIQRECEVNTRSELILEERGVIFALLQHLAPDSKTIAQMAAANGAPRIERLAEVVDHNACILCGLCVEACKAQGTAAISIVGRGVEKRVSTPFGLESADCIGCGKCASVCPTSAIALTASAGTRTTLTFQDARNL